MCVHQWLHTSYTRVCRDCGIEHRTIRLDNFNIYSAPLERGYNRRQRYKVKVVKLIGLHSGPNYEDPIWVYLDKHKITLNTPFDVRECLRSSALKNKHYDNVRTFSDAFTDFRTEYSQCSMKIYLMRSFDNLYAGWCNRSEESFFSYAWLLRFFLEAVNSSLTVYLKPRTCNRRHAKYLSKINAIRSRCNGGIQSYAPSNTHSPSVKCDLNYHPSQLCPQQDQPSAVSVSSGGGRFQSAVDLLRGLQDNCSKY